MNVSCECVHILKFPYHKKRCKSQSDGRPQWFCDILHCGFLQCGCSVTKYCNNEWCVFWWHVVQPQLELFIWYVYKTLLDCWVIRISQKDWSLKWSGNCGLDFGKRNISCNNITDIWHTFRSEKLFVMVNLKICVLLKSLLFEMLKLSWRSIRCLMMLERVEHFDKLILKKLSFWKTFQFNHKQ